MAMYYYARKLQKSARKSKSHQQAKEMLMANGNLSISSVGCVSGTGSGVACASPQPLFSSIVGVTMGGSGKVKYSGSGVGVVPSSNSSTTTDSNSHGQWIGIGQNNCPQISTTKPQVNNSGPSTSKERKNHPDYQQHHQTGGGLIYDEEGCLVSGKLEDLVEHLVPRVDYYPDRPFIFAFVLSSRLFIRPHELLSTVFHHSFQFLEEGGPEGKVVVKHFVQLLSEWMELFPYDFRDDNGMMMSNVRIIINRLVEFDQNVKKDVSILLTSLLSKLTILEKFESMIHKFHQDSLPGRSQPGANPNLGAGAMLALCPDPNLLAEQLTHIEMDRLAFIGAQEFLQAFLKEPSPSGSSPKELKRNRLESYVQWFHRMSLIVATDVCKTGKKRLRARCIEYWVEVARECFNIGNFNSLMAIVTGLNMAPVARLKKTWGKLSYDLLSSLEIHMNPSNNFASYRSLLKSAVWHSSNPADGRQKVVIPFFSLLIKDMYFLKEELAQRLPNGHLNFEKFRKFGRQVGELISWQQITCPFPKVPTIIQTIQTMSTMSESGLLLSSFECESPEGSEEKEMMKSLVDQESHLSQSVQNLYISPSPAQQPHPTEAVGESLFLCHGSETCAESQSSMPEVTIHDEDFNVSSCTLTTLQEKREPP